MSQNNHEKHLTEIYCAAKNAMLEHLKKKPSVSHEEIANFTGILAMHCYEIANEIKPKKQMSFANMHTEPRDIS